MVQFFQLSDRITLYQGLWNYVWSFTLPCPMKCEQKWCVVQWAAFKSECFSQVALGVKNLLANARDIRDSGLIPGLGRTPEGEHGNPLHFSCLENPMDGGAWQATVHAVTKSRTQLSDTHTHIHAQTHTHHLNHRIFFLCLDVLCYQIFLPNTNNCM